MTSKQVVLRVPITELTTLVERKSKQTALNNRPEPMSLPINDLSSSTFFGHLRWTIQDSKSKDKMDHQKLYPQILESNVPPIHTQPAPLQPQ